MPSLTAYHKAIIKGKGEFQGSNFFISTDSVNWIHLYSLKISSRGQLCQLDEANNHYLLLQSLQSCFVQIYPNGAAAGQQQTTKRPGVQHPNKKPSSTNDTAPGLGLTDYDPHSFDEPPVIFIKTYENEKLYIRVPLKNNFGGLISCLIIWQSLKPQGLAKKWYSENKVDRSSVSDTPHELLVCRFKVYGPIPKAKNVNVVSGPRAPVYQLNIDSMGNVSDPLTSSDSTNIPPDGKLDHLHEGWFYTMGVLKSNGILNFITELDGTLLYSIDVKSIMSSEIREVHHSIFDNSNILFIGQIKELRYNNLIKTTSAFNLEQYIGPFLTKEGKSIPSNKRILIEFPLHIDLGDWFVGLNYFAQREYIGTFTPRLMINPSNGKENNDSVKLQDYARENFRISKRVTIDIVEAKFDEEFHTMDPKEKVYAEVIMWGLPWSRTAMVNHTMNPFWKEEFLTDLPISTQMIHILIKRCSSQQNVHSTNDKVIGTVYVTPDIFANQLKYSSTMSTGSNITTAQNIMIKTNATPTTNNKSGSTGTTTANGVINGSSNDIVRLTIYDTSNLPIGKLLTRVQLREHHILPPNHFKPLEKMLVNAPLKDLIKYTTDVISTQDFENVSLMLLDIFQGLGIEDKWFKALMEVELINVDRVTRKNYANRGSIESTLVNNNCSSNSTTAPTGLQSAIGPGSGSQNGTTNGHVKKLSTASGGSGIGTSSTNVFNTLFRGSSIFSKSLEKYNLRVGQEYLEKVLGGLFAKIAKEKKNCEVDSRYVKLQYNAMRKGKSVDDPDADSDFDSDEYDSDEEREKDEVVKQMVEENFQNLYGYAEEFWERIYKTSNDLPQQIKIQLKNFRTKVELACDPEDKITALNCLSAFIFLRFFCPAILNPKLFYLTKDHQAGTTQRTLTLLAKILLNLANRQQFSPHKELHLLKMNSFIDKHIPEVYDYFDKITGRKNDFTEKIFDLSSEVERLDLGLSGDATSGELPMTPYLIDNNLRLTELVQLLHTENANYRYSTSFSPSNGFQSDSSVNTSPSPYHNRESSRESTNDFKVDKEKNVYQIGSLEFEKSEFLDLVADNETEGFIKSLCKSDENIFSFITSNITLQDLKKQANTLMIKINELENVLVDFEYPTNFTDLQLWRLYTQDILTKSYFDTSRSCLVFIDSSVSTSGTYKKISENALSVLKLKFADQSTTEESTSEVRGGINPSFSSTNLAGVLKPKKGIFKRLLKRNGP
ncbi:uncharacterized protein KQ657_002247 [Scheffersomyces spartinae]|uniref:GTPase activating protein n=1 Tax=Scheffersomyces spartinae TaxID=45513 RepID=A0A9P7VDN3_9ASCO|nr:uncharacterized protein KQ657_002247 [Scheffersomyces spartinae]KAG7195862.1 hypothetical protein KQ657_002247 [Scheffersomyces spartinae]